MAGGAYLGIDLEATLGGGKVEGPEDAVKAPVLRRRGRYVTSRDGEPRAVVIMVNNFEGPGAAAVQAIDAIAVKLAEFSRGSD